MLWKVLIVVAVIVIGLAVVVALQPARFPQLGGVVALGETRSGHEAQLRGRTFGRGGDVRLVRQ